MLTKVWIDEVVPWLGRGTGYAAHTGEKASQTGLRYPPLNTRKDKKGLKYTQSVPIEKQIEKQIKRQTEITRGNRFEIPHTGKHKSHVHTNHMSVVTYCGMGRG